MSLRIADNGKRRRDSGACPDGALAVGRKPTAEQSEAAKKRRE